MPVETDRTQFGFAASTEKVFGYLVEDMGFSLVRSGSTFVRYERGDLFLNVFHGRSSYEVGVEIGRLIEVDGSSVEERFPLSDIVALARNEDYRAPGRAATSSAQVQRFTQELAEETRLFLPGLLESPAHMFELLRDQAARFSIALRETWRAQELRRRADEAWRRKDYATVALTYEEMRSELGTVNLKESEAKRLAYAQQHLDETD